MDMLGPALIIGIISYAIYKTFELIIRRRERLTVIEKCNFDGGYKPTMPDFGGSPAFGRFISLRAGCLACGVGLGLIIGILLIRCGILADSNNWHFRDLVHGGSLILFAGVGMLVSFVIEMNMTKKDK